jgi:hypothetical protein
LILYSVKKGRQEKQRRSTLTNWTPPAPAPLRQTSRIVIARQARTLRTR